MCGLLAFARTVIKKNSNEDFKVIEDQSWGPEELAELSIAETRRLLEIALVLNFFGSSERSDA